MSQLQCCIILSTCLTTCVLMVVAMYGFGLGISEIIFYIQELFKKHEDIHKDAIGLIIQVIQKVDEAIEQIPVPEYWFGVEHKGVSGKVNFDLFQNTSNTKIHSRIIPGNASSLKLIHLQEGSTLKILIHGFVSHLNGSFSQKVINAYLKHTNNPVIFVDWSPLAGMSSESPHEKLLYSVVVNRNIPAVADYIWKFITSLKAHNVISSLNQIHLVGHSLGAHVAGQVGKILEDKLEQEKIGRITGLDPAGPHFRRKSAKHKLDKSDANFVDIIHTSRIFGDMSALGHVDFYPNSYSVFQPGCTASIIKMPHEIITNLIKTLSGNCNHHSAIDFFVKSIINDGTLLGCQFLNTDSKNMFRKCSDQCGNSVIFGEHISAEVRGEYCLNIQP